ncbi:MAG: helicase-exonuclease AddAB subunit AddA [Lachnospiraceae bacterium]|jgi:ATP-dependent helicase/nuclease subunit A
MAEIRWTEGQLQAITERGRNILVSAAAGSGKTAVLVERVMRLLTDPDKPADMDSLLIMTFTRAAAAQMKEKINKKIRKALQTNPGNEHLRRQLYKVPMARIYTIDALCMEIVKNNFQLVDVDPGFRIADESEIRLIKKDVMESLLEECYSEPTEDFLMFVNFYIDKSDSRLEEIIEKLFDYAQSYPDPEKWIRDCVAPYAHGVSMGQECSDDQNAWLYDLADYAREELGQALEMAELGLEIARMNSGPDKYEEPFEEIIDFIKDVRAQGRTFDYIGESIEAFLQDWKRSPAIKKSDLSVDSRLKNAALKIRSEIKTLLSGLRDDFFTDDLEQAYMDMAACKDVAEEIARLAIRFGELFRTAKKERNVADFSDVAHYALEILRDGEGYSVVADRMAEELTEIIVDEYQDTNHLQEEIIAALSSERFGRPNVFMVGDVKQSIYGFRKACPELFLEKYHSYPEREDKCVRILLNSNFRSCGEIVDFVNLIFRQTMVPALGGIDYMDGNELARGRTFPEAEQGEFLPEVIFIDGRGDDAKWAEAWEIVTRIRKLVATARVTDESGEGLRPVRYGDIAVLSRTADNPELEEMLEAEHIPFIRASSKGFFVAFEVKLIMNLLRIIDNPLQDIPFGAVLTSPLVGIDADTLARIRLSYEQRPFSLYKACSGYKDNRIKTFLDKLADYRSRASYMGICELMEYIIEDSGLYNILGAMPGGENRRANIDFLKSKAEVFSETSYSGLFDFVRFIEQIRDADIDYGQAGGFTQGADAVRMMTIHRSKGLEFPVVILAKAGKARNTTELSENIILDRHLGIGLEKRDIDERIRKKTLHMKTIIESRRRSDYAEELRVLYVALTRAKEKLIVAGADQLKEAVRRWGCSLYAGKVGMESRDIISESSFLKLMGRSLIRHPDANELYEIVSYTREEIEKLPFARNYPKESGFAVKFLIPPEIEATSVMELGALMKLRQRLETMLNESRAESTGDGPYSFMDLPYPHEKAAATVVKITASQLEKHKKKAEEEEQDAPARMRNLLRYNADETGLRGAERGNAYHRFFELINYSNYIGGEETFVSRLEREIEDLKKRGLLPEEYVAALEIPKIEAFLKSDIGRRMQAAAAAGTLVREQQFVMGEPVEGEQRLLQGIIDAYFIEKDGIVLMDYKTDRGKEPVDFIETYEGQLNAYARVLETALKKPVKEKLIYSVELGCTVRIE